MPLGFFLATASENGRRFPPLALVVLARLLGRLLFAMATAAVVCGLVGYLLASYGYLGLPGRLAEAIPRDHQQRYLAAWCAHGASYVTGIVGGVIVIAVAWRSRRREVRR